MESETYPCANCAAETDNEPSCLCDACLKDDREHTERLSDERDRYRSALEKIVLSASGFSTCTVEYLEAIAEEALKR